MRDLLYPAHRSDAAAPVAGAIAALLPFFVALSPEQAITPLSAKAIWRSGRGDDGLITGAGALAASVPFIAWQMPSGLGRALPLLGIAVAAAAVLVPTPCSDDGSGRHSNAQG